MPDSSKTTDRITSTLMNAAYIVIHKMGYNALANRKLGT